HGGDIGRGDEIAAGSHRAHRGDAGNDVPVEEIDEALDEGRADGGITLGQAVDPREQHGAAVIERHVVPDAAAEVRDQVALQPRGAVEPDVTVHRVAQPGSHPIDGHAAAHQLLVERVGAGDPVVDSGVVAQGDSGPAPGHRLDVL